MVRLQAGDAHESILARASKNAHKCWRKSTRAIMRSHHFRIPIYDMPIRLRPWFLVFTCVIMILLAFLGFTNFSRALPLNDKLLHFICLGVATGVFYFIFDVEEDARRIWFWRWSPLIFTGFVCFFLGGFISELVQSSLPYKQFDFMDVVANLLGSSIGLYISYNLELYYRHRREISRLYRPLNMDAMSDEEDEDDLEARGTQLLPTDTQGRSQNKASQPSKSSGGPIRLADVWDEREELFNIGDSDDEDVPDDNQGPKIVIEDIPAPSNMGAEVHHHRPTLKQQNKRFKSKHATKHAIKTASKGRTLEESVKVSANSSAAAQARMNRKNQAKQAQTKKRQALKSATRLHNGTDSAPRIVAVIPLTEDVNARSTACALAEALDASTDDCPESGLWKLKADRFKTSVQFVNLPYGDIYPALDAAKVADYTVLVLSPNVEVGPWGDTLLRTLQAQGLPDVVSVLSSDASLDPKSRTGVLKSLLSFMNYFVPSQTRVYDLYSSSDRLNALRALCEGKPSEIRWREGRPWILGEKVQWAEGVLSVTGFVRGSHLSADRLVHLPDHGDFQISKIISAPLPKHSRFGGDMEIEPTLLAEPDASSADSLVSSNDPDDMANEQTWPTEEEMKGDPSLASEENHHLPDADRLTTPKHVKRVPKGMSEYQAAWIVDESDEDGESNGQEGSETEMKEGEEAEMEDVNVENEDGLEEAEVDSRKYVAFQDLDMEEEAEQLETWRTRKREEEDDHVFPDEIDTPMDVPARTRFQRYRGLRSFRTSPWDPYENLPRDYARIFQFEDYKRTERNVQRRAEQGAGVEPGVRVTVYIKDAPKEAANKNTSSPFVMFGLLQHEHKKTVLNFTVQRNTEYDGSVRSKDPLILCVGPRRLRINPIYSQHTRGGGKGPNNVHKFERFLKHGVTTVATIYGPVVFGKQPCLLLRETTNTKAPHLVAMGTFLNPDTTRVIAKRIVLSGHPFKLHKKTATVRYMFFNPDDVNYFKPVQLHTKHGRTGHIRESLGTHGYFKAHFDGPINQMDTVCMSLYKRVYPKWGELWRGEQTVGSQDEDGDQIME